MRNLLLALACGLLVSTTAGCMIPAYSADPARRTQELMFTSEGLRHVPGRMGADLVPGSARPHVALSDARRHHLVPMLPSAFGRIRHLGGIEPLKAGPYERGRPSGKLTPADRVATLAIRSIWLDHRCCARLPTVVCLPIPPTFVSTFN